jgi:hypothetical protein
MGHIGENRGTNSPGYLASLHSPCFGYRFVGFSHLPFRGKSTIYMEAFKGKYGTSSINGGFNREGYLSSMGEWWNDRGIIVYSDIIVIYRVHNRMYPLVN